MINPNWPVPRKGHSIHDPRLYWVTDILRGLYPGRIFAECDPRTGTRTIQVFSVPDAVQLREVGEADLLVVDREEPYLVVEMETSTTAKQFGRSIPAYEVARSVRFKHLDANGSSVVAGLPISRGIRLLIITGTRKVQGWQGQLQDLEDEWNAHLNLRSATGVHAGSSHGSSTGTGGCQIVRIAVCQATGVDVQAALGRLGIQLPSMPADPPV